MTAWDVRLPHRSMSERSYLQYISVSFVVDCFVKLKLDIVIIIRMIVRRKLVFPNLFGKLAIYFTLYVMWIQQ